jgi:hypothetical protein
MSTNEFIDWDLTRACCGEDVLLPPDSTRDSPNGASSGEGRFVGGGDDDDDGGEGGGGGRGGRGDGDTTMADAALFSNDNVSKFNGSPVVLLLRSGDGSRKSPSQMSFRSTCFTVDDINIP